MDFLSIILDIQSSKFPRLGMGEDFAIRFSFQFLTFSSTTKCKKIDIGNSVLKGFLDKGLEANRV